MPIPTLPSPESTSNMSLEELRNLVAILLKELHYLLAHLDTRNIDRLHARVIEAGTVTAEKMSVTELSAITANLGTITAGTVTGALIQNQTAAGNKVFTDSAGLHANDAAGVERITIGTTPAEGAKALIGRNSAGVAQSVYTYDTNTVDGASRTGQFITAHGCVILIDSSGAVRILDDFGGGFRALGLGNIPQVSNNGLAWYDVAVVPETGWSLSTGVNTVNLLDKNGNTLSSVTLNINKTTSSYNHAHGITSGRYLKTYDSAGVELGLQQFSSDSHSHTVT